MRVLDSLSKLTTFPLIALEGQPANTEPAKRIDTIDILKIFIIFIIRVCNISHQSIPKFFFNKLNFQFDEIFFVYLSILNSNKF